MHQLILRCHLYFGHKETPKEARAMLLDSPQQEIGCSNIKATPEIVKEILEILGIDFSDFDKCKTAEIAKMEAKLSPLQ